MPERSRVPTILVGPGVPAGARVGRPTSLLDVYPTLLQAFGVPAAAAGTLLDGTSLLDADSLAAREAVVSQYHSNMQNTGTFMLRRADGLKYIAYGGSALGLERAYPPQLFAVESDPDELCDLAADGEHDALVAELDAALRRVVDYPAADRAAKAVDHWLYEQWYVLGDRLRFAEAKWKSAYTVDDALYFTHASWATEWRKAQAWMEL